MNAVANLAPVGPATLRPGALAVTVAGAISQSASSAFADGKQVSILLGGSFFGDGGQRVVGPAVLNIWQNGAPKQAGGSGTHYADRQ